MKKAIQTLQLNFIAGVLFVLPVTAFSQSDSDSVWSAFTQNLDGTLETRFTGYAEDSVFESKKEFFESKLELNWSKYFGDNVVLEISPAFYIDNTDRNSNDWELSEQGLERSSGTLESVVLSYFGDRVEFSAGKQTFAWGKSDLFSPLDSLNPSDLIDLPNAIKLPVTAISAQYLGDNVSAQLIVIPSFVPNRAPQIDNRWTRSTAPLQQAVGAQLGFLPAVAIEDRLLPEANLDSERQYGIQFTSSNMLDGWDLELSYFRGLNSEGVINQQVSQDGVLSLRTLYPAYDQIGLGFSTTAGEFEIHGEAALHSSDNPLFDDDYISYVLGGRYSFYGVDFLTYLEEIAITLEYAGEDIRRSRTEGSPYVSTGIARALSNSILSQINFKVSEEKSLQLGTFYNFDNRDYSTRFKLTNKPKDTLELSTSIELFGGPSDSFFGEWANNDRVSFMVKHYF